MAQLVVGFFSQDVVISRFRQLNFVGVLVVWQAGSAGPLLVFVALSKEYVAAGSQSSISKGSLLTSLFVDPGDQEIISAHLKKDARLDDFLLHYVPLNLEYWKLYREEKVSKEEDLKHTWVWDL